MAKSTENLESKKLSKAKLLDSLQVFKYIRPYMNYFVWGMVCLIVSSLLFMLLMGLPGEMANTAVGKPKFNLPLTTRDFGWVFIIILVIQGVLSYLRTIFFAIVSERGMADLRTDLYDRIITQPMTFFETRRVGELSSRITADVEQLQSVFSITLAEFVRQLVTLIAGIAIIIFWTPKLAMVMLITFPGIVVVAVFFGKYIRKLSKERQDKLADTNTIVDETLQSFSVVKAFANEWYESLRYKKSVKEIVTVSIAFAKVRGVFFVFIITILFGGIFYILWRGALMVESGQMEAGDLFSFIIYTGILGGAIASFGTLYTQIVSAVGATERILEILQTPPEININQENKNIALDIKGNIKFKDIYFSYPTRKEIPVLKGIDLDIPAGRKIALVGQSGSGKSTIVQLLMKFHTPDSGQITIDNQPLDTLDLVKFRNNLGIVPQEVILFGGTIRENIAYGKPSATEDEIIIAAKKSNSWQFISSFTEGLDTVVGERGIKLSGGQRQRIAIARAILKDPKILILDEATSSLDAESEKLVQDALDLLMVNRTSIIIAHRLATIKDVDCIYVLENGQIIEKGTHHELINKEDGSYSALARLQFEFEENKSVEV